MAFWEPTSTPAAPKFEPADVPFAGDEYLAAVEAFRAAEQKVADLGPQLTETEVAQRLRAADAADILEAINARRAGKRDPGEKTREKVDAEIRAQRREMIAEGLFAAEHRAEALRALEADAPRWLDQLAAEVHDRADRITDLLGQLEQATAERDAMHSAFMWVASASTDPTGLHPQPHPAVVVPLADLRAANDRTASHVDSFESMTAVTSGPAEPWPDHLASVDAYIAHTRSRPSKYQGDEEHRRVVEVMLSDERRRYAAERSLLIDDDGNLTVNPARLRSQWLASGNTPATTLAAAVAPARGGTAMLTPDGLVTVSV